MGFLALINHEQPINNTATNSYEYLYHQTTNTFTLQQDGSGLIDYGEFKAMLS
jgi:hypothetical protein